MTESEEKVLLESIDKYARNVIEKSSHMVGSSFKARIEWLMIISAFGKASLCNSSLHVHVENVINDSMEIIFSRSQCALLKCFYGRSIRIEMNNMLLKHPIDWVTTANVWTWAPQMKTFNNSGWVCQRTRRFAAANLTNDSQTRNKSSTQLLAILHIVHSWPFRRWMKSERGRKKTFASCVVSSQVAARRKMKERKYFLIKLNVVLAFRCEFLSHAPSSANSTIKASDSIALKVFVNLTFMFCLLIRLIVSLNFRLNSEPTFMVELLKRPHLLPT